MGKSITVGGDEGRFLEVQVQGQKKIYRVPLSGSMKMADAMALSKVMRAPRKRRSDMFLEWFYGFFCRYVPEKVTGELSMGDFEKLAIAWNDASEREGAGPGE